MKDSLQSEVKNDRIIDRTEQKKFPIRTNVPMLLRRIITKKNTQKLKTAHLI